jgi:hypothetical protein
MSAPASNATEGEIDMIVKSISVAACLFVVACGGEGDEGATAPAPTSYQEMNFAQREAFMQDVVLPQMTEVFVAFDAKFEGMSCATCHGEGTPDGPYAMPNPQMAPLPPTEEAFFEFVQDAENARWSMFMLEQVWPQMAALLQVDTFDPATAPNGFSCSNCHTTPAIE